MKLRFVPVDTVSLVQIEDTSVLPDVKGAIVKVAPLLRTSQRATFDGPGLVQRLREEGALAVQLSPRTVQEVEAPAVHHAVSNAPSPEEAIQVWFSELKGVPDDERADAEALALELLRKDRGG